MSGQTEEVLRVVPSVDTICFRLLPAGRDLDLEVLLARRSREPFAGRWALPGGVTRSDERLADAARRLLRERAGLDVVYLEQLYTFDDPARDPRGRTLSIAYLALLPLADTVAQAGRDIEEVTWWPVRGLAAEAPLAFDHATIIHYAHERLRSKVEWTPLVFRLLPEVFTLPEVRRVYEAIQGERHNDSNFRRQLLARFPGLQPAPEKDRRTNRPAQLFRYLGSSRVAGPPDPAID